MRVHSGDLHKCPKCPAAVTTKYKLETHIRNVHYPEQQVCHICATVVKSEAGKKVPSQDPFRQPETFVPFLC